MAGITVFTNAFLIDCTGKDPVDGAAVVVEGERIKEVIRSGKVGPLKGRVDTINCKGKTLMPGLTDAHVHMCAVDANIPEQHRNSPPSLIAAKAMRRIEQALMQGFTTVRDAGGADYGFREAVSSGLYPGPRLLVSGRALSPTGGRAGQRGRGGGGGAGGGRGGAGGAPPGSTRGRASSSRGGRCRRRAGTPTSGGARSGWRRWSAASAWWA